MEREHYLDNSATTPVLPQAAEAALRIMVEDYGNPSSLHTKGFEARRAVEEARQSVAAYLGVSSEEITFTSGGTEGNNLAVFGAAQAKKRLGNKIVTTAAEHDSVIKAMEELEKEGFEVTYIRPDSQGNIHPDEVADAIDDHTVLVSMMLVNNETGAIFPVEAATKAVKRKKAPALLHTDAVQAMGKLTFNPQKLGVDLCTVSGHKVNAPKGIGALWVKKGVRILPRAFGGGQEKGLRSGTESVPLICAFGEAVKAMPSPKDTLPHARELNALLLGLLSQMPQVTVNSPENGLPYVVNLSAGRVRAETMLHFLAERGVFVSSGSACGKAKPSHVLAAMGLPKDRIDSALRVSFSRFTTEDDIRAFVTGLQAGLSTLAHQ